VLFGKIKKIVLFGKIKINIKANFGTIVIFVHIFVVHYNFLKNEDVGKNKQGEWYG